MSRIVAELAARVLCAGSIAQDTPTRFEALFQLQVLTSTFGQIPSR